MKVKLILMLLGIFLFLTNGFAATIIVHPGESLQNAINSSQDGDDILVENGVYAGDIVINNSSVEKSLTIRSYNGPEVTTLEGGLECTAKQKHVTILGFTFKSSIILRGAVTFQNNIITGSLGSLNALINCYGSPEIVNNTFAKNNTSINKQIWCYALEDSPTNSPLIVNNIFVKPGSGYAVRCETNNPPLAPLIAYNDFSGWSSETNALMGCSAGNGNIYQDPKFVKADAPPYNFHLLSGSPCIDAGDPSSTFNDADGTKNDLGAFGGPATQPLPPNQPPVAEAGEDKIASANETVNLDGSGSYDSDGNIIAYTWIRMPDNALLYSGPNPTFETKALGRVEETIALTVKDNRRDTATDTMTILNKKISDMTNKVDGIELIVNPSLTISSPVEGSTVNGVVNVCVASSRASALYYCCFYVDDKYMSYAYSAPFSFIWDSRYWANGGHTLKITGYFRDGSYASKTATATVNSQNNPVLTPSISITSPKNGTTVSRTITITTDATAENFYYVYYYVDNIYKGYDNTYPFEFTLNTAALSNGMHTIKVYGWHKLVNQAVYGTISVNVSN